MPVSINFNKAITDKKAVQSGITVTSSSGQEVVGHWFNGQRLDFRPEQYWQAGSTVTLKLDLDGVEGAEGVFGVQQKTVTFKIGRNQVSHRRRVKAKTMTVTRDGKTIKTIPISAGAPDNPTYNGQMVISEKFKETRMDGSTVGFTKKDGKGEYDIKDVPHAMRLSTSGTFIHGNYWGADSIFGSANTSHGCVGLNDVKGAGDPNQPAAWFFDNSMVGDVVDREELPGQDHPAGQRPQRLEHELERVEGRLRRLSHRRTHGGRRHPRGCRRPRCLPSTEDQRSSAGTARGHTACIGSCVSASATSSTPQPASSRSDSADGEPGSAW